MSLVKLWKYFHSYEFSQDEEDYEDDGNHDILLYNYLKDGFIPEYATRGQRKARRALARRFVILGGVPYKRSFKRDLGSGTGVRVGYGIPRRKGVYCKGRKAKDLESAECAMEGLSDRTSVVFRPELRNWQSSVRDGLLEAGVDPYNGFSLVGTKIGGSTFDGSGRRHSAADLLNYENPVNIKVAVYASVERILLASSSPYSGSKQSAMKQLPMSYLLPPLLALFSFGT
ncbi:UNVERIFIED_CONTAM: (R)-mandelonitrile lyase-like [Sesamum calycinum]|uniref:(R)-mandelonitrile lyase-like n=1 Tax=Sesamum calycinum TaxID=2727403 RepID=A0AAW2L9E6_9LAMI